MRVRYERSLMHLFLSFLFLLLFFLTGCSKKEEEKGIKIGVSISNFEDRFLSYVKGGMEDYQMGLGNIEVIYFDADEDFQKQEGQVGYILEQEVDALVVLPVNTAFTAHMTNMAKKAKVPIVYVNRYPAEFLNKDLPEDTYYIGSKEKTAGVIQMEYLAEKLGGRGDVAILMGSLVVEAAFERTEGVEEVARRYPEINIVKKSSGRWLRALAESIVEEWLRSGVEFDAIAANNDEMAIGAIRTLEKYKKLDEVIVVGIDATIEAKKELEAGNLAATVFQDGYSQGRYALETAYKISQGEAVKNITWIPFKLITQDNFEEIE